MGIGFNGYPVTNEFAIPLDAILPGGSGAKIRCCGTPTTKKVRLKCCGINCEQAEQDIHIMFQYVSSCQFPLDEYDTMEPIDVYDECGCVETCCQKLTRVAAQINAQTNSPVNAAYVPVGTEHYLELTAKAAGQNFEVSVHEGLTAPVTVVPYFAQDFSAKTVKNWFTPEVLGACDTDRCLNILEISFVNMEHADQAGGSVTSNPGSSFAPLKEVIRHASIVFDPAVANSTTAFTALKTILTGTDERNKLLKSTTCEDFPEYRFCIARTDTGVAGDPANITDVRTDYATAVISITRAFWDGTKSYYTLRSTSSVAPTADGADVVTAGGCGSTNLPCAGPPDTCPPSESLCVGC